MHLNNNIRRENKERNKNIMEKLTLGKNSGGPFFSGSLCNLLCPLLFFSFLFLLAGFYLLEQAITCFMFIPQQAWACNYFHGQPISLATRPRQLLSWEVSPPFTKKMENSPLGHAMLPCFEP